MRGAEFYQLVVWITLGMGALTLGMLLLAIVNHALVSIQLLLSSARRELLLPLLCVVVAEPERRDELLSHVRGSDRRVLLPALLQLALDLRGEELKAIRELAEVLGLTATERRRITSWRPAQRAAAAKNLGLLRDRAAMLDLLRVLKRDSDSSVRLAGVWALGEIGGDDAVLGLFLTLEDPDPGIVRRAQETLLASTAYPTPHLVSYVRRSRVAAARYAAIEVLGELRDPFASELLLDLMCDADRELRIRATKAAASIGDPRFAGPFGWLLGDASWEVRCQAARGLGVLAASESIGVLCRALSDEAWWVRFNAATSLARLGFAGEEALLGAVDDPHPLAREVARYVVQRDGLTRAAA